MTAGSQRLQPQSGLQSALAGCKVLTMTPLCSETGAAHHAAWAHTSTVRWLATLSRASCTRASLSASSALVACTQPAQPSGRLTAAE